MNNYLLIQSAPYSGKAYSALTLEVIQTLASHNINISILDLSTSIEVPKVEESILQQDKLIFFLPEYNGSFPGKLKDFIDSQKMEIWRDKKALLIGYSGGQFGNARGMSHLTDILNYLKVNVYCDKLSIPYIKETLEDTKKSTIILDKLSQYLVRFMNF